jgi:2-keto-4-pentenoate hydratase/2-oxohepta-3-ene-1,7-dioic acid hydratase in catechol pathway
VAQGDKVLDLCRADPSLPPSLRGILEEGLLPRVRAVLASAPADAWIEAARVRFGPPVPDPRNIVCLGLNYRDHAEEMKLGTPAAPLLFSKAAGAIAGAYDPIPLGRASKTVDIEAELAVVIGTACRNLSEADAPGAIAGYSILNDVSGRDIQFGDKQWYRGKSQDGYAPFGPFLATPDEIPDPHALRVVSRVNGETWQASGTRFLIFGVPKILAFITEGITLFPGDVVATGTPAGVGYRKTPPKFLKPGDTVEIEIERLGIQRTKVIE